MAIQYAVGLVASVGIGVYLIRNIYVVLSGQASEKDLVTVQSSLDEIETGSDQNTRDNGDKGVQK